MLRRSIRSAHPRLKSRGFDYCFFTRILPLNDSSSTEDEPELEVPAKERPWSGTKVMWDLAWRGKLFSTEPRNDRAVRSTDALSGRVTSIAPVWVERR